MVLIVWREGVLRLKVSQGVSYKGGLARGVEVRGFMKCCAG